MDGKRIERITTITIGVTLWIAFWYLVGAVLWFTFTLK